ncbi:GGDEF domain-containing protein [Aureimonas glaciei]|uniref:GGDEF domain-containing protein n=2 Tax=Aureimonas glaciei TaxID=1776957 RepID=A0A916YAZ0_9HYPH|nr:GGDEF domain-containing protein [Aureimonas glaciei]
MLHPNTRDITEEQRLAELEALGIADIGPSASLDRICDLARHVFAVPFAYISILDRDTQWPKAQCGVSLDALPRRETLCDHAIRSDEVLVVPDTLKDERFSSSPLVAGDPRIRFYAGAPLLAAPGVRLGALCVADTIPREFSQDRVGILLRLAEAAMAELRRHRADVQAVAEREELKQINTRTADREDELLKQRTLLSHAETISTSGSWEVDRANGLLTWSDGMYRLLGAEPDAGHDPAELFRRSVIPEDLHLLEDGLLAVSEGRPFSHEIRVIDARGRVRHLSSRGGPIQNVAGRLSRMVGILCDVSESKAIEAALRDSEDHHRHAVELSPQIPWIADGDGLITEAGPRWVELTGMTQAATLGHGWRDALHPDDLAPTTEKWVHALKERTPLDTEYRVRLLSGSFRWFRAYAAPRLAPDGSVKRWYGSLENIHDRKLAEETLRQSVAFARSVLDGSPDFVAVLDLEGRVRSLGWQARQRLGPEVATRVLGRHWANGWPKSHRVVVEQAIASARAGVGHRFSCHCPERDGADAWWDVSVDPVRDADGKTTHILAISRDVSDQERMRLEVEAARAQLAEVLESTTDNVIVVDRNFHVTYMNPQAKAFVGGTSTLEVGGCLWDAYPEYLAANQRFEAVLQRGEAAKFEMFASRAGIWLEIHAFPNGNGGISLFFRDITEARQAREEIVHLAHHDPLTGLSNRLSFSGVLEDALARQNHGLAVLLLDLDLFKEVNDTLGHPVGDVILQRVAARLRETVGDAGHLARLGGDEFAVAMTAQDAEAVLALGERMVACLEPPFDIDGQVIRISASVGVSIAAAGCNSADELFKASDIALYRAKAVGGGSVCLFEEAMLERIRFRQAIKHDLGLALERGELHLVYQPLLDLGSNRVSGFEALLRWDHEDRGTVSPAEFIPIAEEKGLIVPIGNWVLETACQEAAGWPEASSVAVNVSAVQFRSDSLPLMVAGALNRSGLLPHRLELEITESVLLHDSEHNMAILHALKKLGVRIVLDDFGTGFSSLSYLRLFPFDKLKLDRCFVSDIGRSVSSEAIIRATGEMGRALSMVTTAEGVETMEQLEWLRANGWAQVQGYLVGRPSKVPSTSIPDIGTATVAESV